MLKAFIVVENADSDECVICCEDLHDVSQRLVRISANCNHLLHSACRAQLMSSSNVNKLCPVCRKPIVDPTKASIAVDSHINEVDMDGYTPLYRAVQSGNVAEIVALIKQGADVLAEHKNGGTPLHCAARNGRSEVVELLLAKGANTKAVNKEGLTPLNIAARNGGHGEVVQLLLAKGANTKGKK